MTDAPNLDPLPENVEGQVIEQHTFSHELHHQIPWGYVALGVGLVALAYVLHQYLNEDDESAESGPESAPQGASDSPDDFVDVELQGAAEAVGAGLLG